jgi:plasmid rolling circle replication initiator protein Rep
VPDNLVDELYLSDVSQKDKPWDVHRTTATAVQRLYSCSEYQGYADRIGACSKLLEFGLVLQESGEQKFNLTAARFCRVRHCPVCQWRRTLMWVARALQGMPHITQDYPKARWLFLTLTVRNCELSELRQTVINMNAAFKKLAKRKQWPALGWAKSLEVTRNQKDGTAHPHFHILMLVPTTYFGNGYLSQEKWRKLWESCLGSDYLPVVNIKTVKPKSEIVNKDAAISAAIRETFKYAVKPDDLIADEQWLHGLTDQLHKMRSIAIGGVLKNYWKADEPEDLIESEDDKPGEVAETDPRVWFGWRERVNRYAKVDLDHGEKDESGHRATVPNQSGNEALAISDQKKRKGRIQLEFDIQ